MSLIFTSAFIAIGIGACCGMVVSPATPEQPRELLYTRREAAKLLRVSERTLDRLLALGEVKSCRFGPRGVRISAEAIRQAIESKEAADV